VVVGEGAVAAAAVDFPHWQREVSCASVNAMGQAGSRAGVRRVNGGSETCQGVVVGVEDVEGG